MTDKDNQVYTAIIECAIFAYFKEKYPHGTPDDASEKSDIQSITNLLLKIEKYSHIPDKERLVRECYRDIKEQIKNDEFREENLQNMLAEITDGLSDDEKYYILNAVVLIVLEDGKVSDVEKSVILQVSKYLGFDQKYEKILKRFKSSEFYVEDTRKDIIFGGLLLIGLAVAAFMYVSDQKPKINLFQTDKYEFYELTFNRYIFYKKKFLSPKTDDVTRHFRKYAVYYISGKAVVSFNPKLLQLNSEKDTVSIPESAFKVEINVPPSKELEIDKANPKPITESEANKMAAVVGLAAGVSVAKGSWSLTKFLPPNVQPYAAAISGGLGAVGGGAAYLVTSNVLDGLKLSSDISETERDEVLKTGKHLIKAQVTADEAIRALYKEQFETFIKAKYQAVGINVSNIQYLGK